MNHIKNHYEQKLLLVHLFNIKGNARKIESIWYNFVCVNQSASDLLQLIPNPFPGKVVYAEWRMPRKRFTIPPANGVSVHFNYAFVTVNSEILLEPGTFFFIPLFLLARFLTGSLLGTFCSDHWYTLLDDRSFTDQTYISMYAPFQDCWSRAGHPHQGRNVNPSCFSPFDYFSLYTAFLFVLVRRMSSFTFFWDLSLDGS